MLNVDVTQLVHRHGDAWSPMQEREAHTPDNFDPERKLVAGYRVFRCTDCGEEVSIQTPESR
jgi:hypothetical protein